MRKQRLRREGRAFRGFLIGFSDGVSRLKTAACSAWRNEKAAAVKA